MIMEVMISMMIMVIILMIMVTAPFPKTFKVNFGFVQVAVKATFQSKVWVGGEWMGVQCSPKLELVSLNRMRILGDVVTL